MARRRAEAPTTPGDVAATDDTLNDAIGRVPDQESSEVEFRDSMSVNGALSDGALNGLDGEVQAQQQAIEQDTIATLETMRGLEAGDRVKWRISRTGHLDEKWNGYLETWPNHHCTIERIKQVFGGGTYYCMGFRNGKYWTHKTVTVAGESILMPGQKSSDLGGPGSSATDFRMLLAQQDQREQVRAQREEERRERERKDREERDERERKNRNELLAMVLPAVTGLTTAIVGAFANRGSQMADIAALMTAMKGPDPMTVLTQLKALEKSNDSGLMTKLLPNLLELATSRASTGDSGWIDVVKELAKSAGPAVGTLVQGAIEQANQTRLAQSGTSPVPLTVPTLPNPTPGELPARSARSAPLIVVPESRRPRDRPVISASSRSNVESVDSSPLETPQIPNATARTVGLSSPSMIPVRGADMDLTLLPFMPLLQHQTWLVGKLQQLGWAAQRRKDAELYAALFLEELPEGVDARLVAQLLARADWYQLLCQLEPRLQREDFLPWFDQLRAHLLRSIQEETGVAVGIQQAAGQTSAGVQKVEVRGPNPHSGGNSAPDPSTAPVSAPSPVKEEVTRPTKIPDLYGRIEE